jgi:general secretion pathway protein G
VRKDHALNPINSDYDLYSLGKNGVSKKQISQKDSVDDIIRARDGGFIGLAADF